MSASTALTPYSSDLLSADWHVAKSLDELLGLSHASAKHQKAWLELLASLSAASRGGAGEPEPSSVLLSNSKTNSKTNATSISKTAAFDLRALSERHEFNSEYIQASLENNGRVFCAEFLGQLPPPDTVLVLFETYIFLPRIWAAYASLEKVLQQRIDSVRTFDTEQVGLLERTLKALFSDGSLSAEGSLLAEGSYAPANEQLKACAVSVAQPFSLVAGGPGTGKTTTAVKIALTKLVLLKHCSDRSDFANARPVRLLAPTGKAAVRLYESFAGQMDDLLCELGKTVHIEGLQELLPEAGETIHRMVMSARSVADQKSSYFGLSPHIESHGMTARRADRYGSEIYPALIIVDEASMIDLALMKRLFACLDERTDIVFLGDPAQLPPVEAGDVFAQWVERFAALEPDEPASKWFSALGLAPSVPSADIANPQSAGQMSLFDADVSCDQDSSDKRTLEAPIKGISNPLSTLRKTYRFSGKLGELAQLFVTGSDTSLVDWKQFWDGMNDPSDGAQSEDARSDRALNYVSVNFDGLSNQSSLQKWMKPLAQAYQPYFDAMDADAEVESLAELKSRYQILVSTYLGPFGVHAINEAIEREYLLSKFGQNGQTRSTNALYAGKPILVTRNQPELNLFNGDIGYVIQKEGRFLVSFPDKPETVLVSIEQLELWQTAYAITIHKSQGSEYQHVGIVLPSYSARNISKRLVYTAITRAKKCVDFYANGAILEPLLCS